MNNEPITEKPEEVKEEIEENTNKKEISASAILDAIVSPKPQKQNYQDFKFFINQLPPSPIPELSSVCLGMCESPEDDYVLILDGFPNVESC